MAAYPKDTLHNFVHRVFVCEELYVSNISIGGTNFPDVIIIATNGSDQHLDSNMLEQAFHHELSSLIMRHHPDRDFERQWIEANSAAVNYGNNVNQTIRNALLGKQIDWSLIPDGILTKYSLSSMEEDVNIYAERMMTGDNELIVAMERSTPVRTKVGVLISYYDRVFGYALRNSKGVEAVRRAAIAGK